MAEESTTNVFVYGTLRKGYYNHNTVMGKYPDSYELTQPTAELTTANAYMLFDEYFIPYVILNAEPPTSGDTATFGSGAISDSSVVKPGVIVGEVYTVKRNLLDALDELEGVPENRYARSTVPLKIPTGEIIACEIYHVKNVPSEEIQRKLQDRWQMTGITMRDNIRYYDYGIEDHERHYVKRTDREPNRYSQECGMFL